ncbi:hypothetical protein RND71_005491 [Anisodus tanguticus]|uniref:Uncharacterized protein n=1 Tax=Anisodus tanguticus TaxID=243964 RepID=A0AAE1VV18_9SOLA|nr:hypothetical protein RND71_005491 [Anisodus tanguticus]
MAKLLVSYTTFLAILLCFLLISSNEMQAAEGKTCRNRSKVYTTSICVSSTPCARACKIEYRDDYIKGECIRKGFLSRYCFCSYKDDKCT